MIAKTLAEKQEIKKAKRSYSENRKQDSIVRMQMRNEEPRKVISTGILEDEDVLPIDYPIYAGYLYVAEFSDGKAEVVYSYVKGNPINLIRQVELGRLSKVSSIRRCNLSARNIY